MRSANQSTSQTVSQYSQADGLKRGERWTTQAVIVLFGWIVANSGREKFLCPSRHSYCKMSIQQTSQAVIAISQQTRQLFFYMINKAPGNQANILAGMRGQRILFLFSFNPSLTLYSSIQSVREKVVLPGSPQVSHPGKRSLRSVSQSRQWVWNVVSDSPTDPVKWWGGRTFVLGWYVLHHAVSH